MSLNNILLAVMMANRLKSVKVEKLRRGVRKPEVRERIRDLSEQMRRAGVL